ncbi:MAG: hypothetical protein AB7H77_01415 [Bdellovibrionales bacterium]
MRTHFRAGLFITALLLTISACPAFAADTAPQIVTNPNLAGGPEGHGSRLNPNDTIVIEAPVATELPANPAGTAVCYSVRNQTLIPYFVPWNSPTEWSAFLSAVGASSQLSTELSLPATPDIPSWLADVSVSTCCAPQEAGEICTTQNKTVISHDQLGYRFKGTPGGEQTNWGAQGDVYGPVYASNVDGDPNLTYRVTFVCSRGTWVKTHEEGSCVPVDGQCASGVVGLTELPADVTTLCTQESLFGGFTNPGGAAGAGPWTWTCLGTPGKSNATCTTDAPAAMCGAAAGVPTGWTTPVADLCADGATPSAVTGPDVNIFTGSGTTVVDNLWHWTCTADNGSPPTACTAPSHGACANGTWDVVTGVTRPNPPDPAQEMLCDLGVPTAVSYEDNIWGFGTNKIWTWTCTAPGGWDDHCAIFDSTSGMLGDDDPHRSTCGASAGGTYAEMPTSLCYSGIPSEPWTDGSRWFWTCESPRGSKYGCYAYLLLDGACGPATGVPSANAPSNLCSVGSPVSLVNDGNFWIWDCAGPSATTTCSAPAIDGDDTPPDPPGSASCGSANGSSSSTAPVFSLCTAGTPSTVTNDGNGKWVWTCQSDSQPRSCSASAGPGNTPTGPGICGAAHNTAIPDEPNYNLCSSGTPSAVTGNGPWSWTCTGTGSGAGTNSSCSARMCQACAGSGSAPMTSATISGTYQGCAVTGYASWTQTDSLGASNASARLQWSDAFFGTFSTTIVATVGPSSMCQPCYETARSVSGAQVIVRAAPGSCPGNSALNSGNPVAISPSNVTLTPQ